jgi:hypothetical protein
MARQFKGADGKTYTWVDADTFTDGDQSYRVEGYNAPETAKVLQDEDVGLRFKRGQLGGDETTKAVEGIASAGGFNVIEDLDRTDSFGRKRVRLKNNLGDDLTNTLYNAGAIDVNRFTDEAGQQAILQGRITEQLGQARKYDDIVAKELSAIQNRPVTFKATATNEQEYSQAVMETVASQMGLDLTREEDIRRAMEITQSGNYDARGVPFQAIEFRSPDRTRENVARDQMSTAWNQGWKGMATGLAGFAELAGVSLGSETLEKWGADKVDMAKEDLLAAPALTNMDYRDVDSLWDAWGYMTNNLAMSAPYLVTLTAGTLAAPVTGGASAVIAYGSTGATYAGQVWNDIQGPKGRAEAAGSILAGTGMALLDRLGMAGIMKPSSVLTARGRAELAKQLASKKNISIMAAKEEVRTASQAVIKETIQGMGNFASDNINNSGILKEVLKSAGKGALAEGITEAAQEGLGYLASGQMSTGGLRAHYNPDEFINLLTSSAIAGGTLGGGFSASGRIIEAGDRYRIARGLDKSDADKANEYEQILLEQGNQGSTNVGPNSIVAQLTEETKNISPSRDSSITAIEAERGKINRGNLWNKIKNAPEYLPELYRASATNFFRPETLRKLPSAQKLYALLGQPLGKLYSGQNVEQRESYVRSNMLEIINPKRTFKRFGMKDNITNSQKISDMIRRYMNSERDIEVTNNLAAIEATITELREFSDTEYTLKNSTYKSQKAGRADLPATDDWWLKHQSWDWQKVRNNRNAWFKFMRDNTQYTTPELEALYNKISNNENATDFSVVEGVEFIPGSAKGATDAISSKPGYDKFANTNILQNMINAANQTSKYVAYTEFFGAGGKNIDYLLNKMAEEGATQDELARAAYGAKSIIDAGTGNYKPILNRKIAAFQNSAAHYAAMVGLPLSAISSLPEFGMMLYQGMGNKDTRRALEKAIGELRDIFKNIAEMKIHPDLLNTPKANVDRNSQQRLTAAGLFNDDAAIATRLGLGESDVAKAWWQKQFFKYSGISGLTQFQRALAAAAVTGFVSDRIKILAAKPADAELNQTQQDMLLQLTNLGIDVDLMIDMYNKYNDPTTNFEGETLFDTLMDDNPATDEDYKLIDQQMDIATWNFVNDRIQNPGAFNRPLFFQDPHYQLFVQFNGFISTFTANIIPRLWNDYLKNGSPTMKYNTFAMLVTMMAFAGASQWLKDFIKFGGSTPYLTDAQLLQRALQASGILGTGERVLQAALPLYRSRDESILDRLFGETVGASPAVRLAGTAARGIKALGEGETERAAKAATGLIPGIGPVTPIRNVITDLVHGRSPDPYPFREGE